MSIAEFQLALAGTVFEGVASAQCIEKQLRNNFLAKKYDSVQYPTSAGDKEITEWIPTQLEDPNKMEFLKTITQSILKLETNIPLHL